MRAVAAIVSIIIFLAFVTTGAQKLIFNTLASHAAEHLRVKKRWFRLAGLVEILGAIAVMVGLAARRGSALATLNLVAAALLLTLALAQTLLHWRRGDGLRQSLPTMLLALACLVDVVARLT